LEKNTKEAECPKKLIMTERSGGDKKDVLLKRLKVKATAGGGGRSIGKEAETVEGCELANIRTRKKTNIKRQGGKTSLKGRKRNQK